MRLFTRPALRLLHYHARGVPRLVNMIAHRALLAAYVRRRRRVTFASVRQAYREIRAVPLAARSRLWRVGWVVGALALALGLGATQIPDLDERLALLRRGVPATMTFENGVHAVYEGSCSNAVGLNTFYKEYIRVDGEKGTAILNHRDLEVFARQDIWRQEHREGHGQKIALLTQPKWLNPWLIERFAAWRAGGPALETEVSANLWSSAMVFAAIESSRTGTPVRVADLVRSSA
jgi:hypothetical protein